MISPCQIRQARAALDLSQGEVSAGVGMSDKKLSRLEKGTTEGTAGDLALLKTFFENRGLAFTDGDGVRQRQEFITYRGADGFRQFMDDVYHVASTEGGEIRLYNARPANWIRWAGQEWWDRHIERMIRARKERHYTFKVTAQRGDYTFIASAYAEYRWVPDILFNQKSIYVYGDRLALMDFGDEDVSVFVIHKNDFANSFIHLFDVVWDAVSIIPDSDKHEPWDM